MKTRSADPSTSSRPASVIQRPLIFLGFKPCAFATNHYSITDPLHRWTSTRSVVFRLCDVGSKPGFYRLKKRFDRIETKRTNGRTRPGDVKTRTRGSIPSHPIMMANGATALSARASLSRTTVRIHRWMIARAARVRTRVPPRGSRVDAVIHCARRTARFFTHVVDDRSCTRVVRSFRVFVYASS